MYEIRRVLGHKYKWKICRSDEPYSMYIIMDIKDIDAKFYRGVRSYLGLRNPKKKVKKIVMNEFQAYLADIVNLINKIPGEKKREFGKPIKKERYIFSDKFKDKSHLNWDRAYPISDINFKYKFLTVILLTFIQDMQTYLDQVDDNDKLEYLYLVRVIDQMRDCIPLFISSPVYINSITMIRQKSTVINGINKNSRKFNIALREMIDNLRSIYKKNIFGDIENVGGQSDDITIDLIIKTAYELATNNTDMSNLPKFKDYEGIKIGDRSAHSLVKKLGKAVKTSHSEKIVPDMFIAFMLANPVIPGKDDNDNMKMGRYALEYLKLMVNDEVIGLIIDKLERC